MALPTGPFGCILADPPWNFITFDGKKAVPTQADDPYPTLSLQKMMRLPIADIAAPDCALFMWSTGSHMLQAMTLAESWDFRFVTDAFYWFKSRGPHISPVPGMGYWTRKQVEPCLLFTRGKPKRKSKGVEQALFCGRGEHSAKPDEQYHRIEALVDGPYLELFSRQSWPGWQAWGNETGKRDATLFDAGRAA